MRKKDIERKSKMTTKTYMREAINYEIVIQKASDDLFYTIKKYNKMKEPFTLKNSDNQYVTYINEGYYVVEITPLKENYNIRFYVDDKLNVIDYYIDITLFNGEVNKVPYYVDLYLDIVHYPKDDSHKFCDEDELLNALNDKVISKKDYRLAYNVGNKLLEEVNNHNNRYINTDVISLIKKYFK